MKDDTQLIKAGFAGLQMTRPAQAIIDAGHARRRRTRLTGASALVVAVGAGAAAVVPAFAGEHTNAHPQVAYAPQPDVPTEQPGTSTSPSGQVDIEMAGFSVRSQAGGALSITVGQLSDPTKLEQVLDSAGAPTTVSVDKYCETAMPPITGPDDWRLKTVGDPGPVSQQLKPGESVGDLHVFVLYPAELHPGWKYGLSVITHAAGGGGGAALVLLAPGVPVTCHT